MRNILGLLIDNIASSFMNLKLIYIGFILHLSKTKYIFLLYILIYYKLYVIINELMNIIVELSCQCLLFLFTSIARINI